MMDIIQLPYPKEKHSIKYSYQISPMELVFTTPLTMLRQKTECPNGG